MNDRMCDLGSATNLTAHSDDTDGDVEMGKRPYQNKATKTTNNQPRHMKQFFEEVDKIKNSIEYIKSSTQTIGEINEQSLQATSPQQEKELSQQVRSLVDETNKRAKATKDLLGLLKQDNESLQQTGEGKPSDLRYVIFIE